MIPISLKGLKLYLREIEADDEFKKSLELFKK